MCGGLGCTGGGRTNSPVLIMHNNIYTPCQVAPYDLLAGLQAVQDEEVMQRMKQAALKLQEEALQPDEELISSS